MHAHRLKGLTIAIVIAFGVLESGSAHASTTDVTAAIKAQDKIIHALPADKQLVAHLLKSTSAGEAHELVALIGPLVTRTDHAIDTVARSSRRSAFEADNAKAKKLITASFNASTKADKPLGISIND